MEEETNFTIKNDYLTKVGKARARNLPCWCGSGKKIKKCSCLYKMNEHRDETIKKFKEKAMEKYLKENVDKNKVVLLGRSLGSGVAVNLSVKRDVAGLILVTPYDTIENVAMEHFPKILVKMILRDKYRSIEYSKNIKAPALLLAAEKDRVIPPKHAEELYKHISSDKKMIIIKDTGHNDIAASGEYWDNIFIFLKDILEKK